MAAQYMIMCGKMHKGETVIRVATWEQMRQVEDDDDEQYQLEEHKRENPCSYPDYPNTDEVASDSELQRIIDEGEMTAEYEDWLIDVEWLRQGCN